MLEKNKKSYVEAVLNAKNVPVKYAAVLNALLDRAYYSGDGMEVVVNTYVKKQIASSIGMKSPGPVNTAINAMINTGILTVIESGAYGFSHEVFGPGKWGSVKEIRIIQSFGEEETVFSTEIEYMEGYVYRPDRKKQEDAEVESEGVAEGEGREPEEIPETDSRGNADDQNGDIDDKCTEINKQEKYHDF